MTSLKSVKFIFPLVFLVSYNAWSASEHDDHDHQGAHVHGIAEVTIALEGAALEIGFDSPAVNIVGFEHKAQTKEQKKAVKQAKGLLESPALLMDFVGGKCQLKEAEVDVSSVMAEEKSGHEHDHDEHHHDDKHHHEKNDHAEKASHGEVHAMYSFQCQDQLTSLNLKFFEHFPQIESLTASWVTDSKQGSIQLKPNSTSTVQLK